MRKQSGTQVFRITGARTGLAEDVRGRQRRYVASMLVRTLAVILTVVLWNVERYVAIGTLVLGAALPYIAVVIANAGRENAPSLPSTFVTTPTRPMIAPQDDSDASGSRGGDGAAAAESVPEGSSAGPDAGPDAGAGSEPGERA